MSYIMHYLKSLELHTILLYSIIFFFSYNLSIPILLNTCMHVHIIYGYKIYLYQ